MIWLKVGLIVSLLVGAIGAVKLYTDNAEALGAAQTTIADLREDLADRDTTIAELRASRDLVNTRLVSMIVDNNAAVEAEVERRRLIAIERDRAREALRIALDAIRTGSENDAQYVHWLDQPVPAAAWDRLRAIAE
jgi:DNA-binding XRE family transcriptional regulator